MYSFHYIYVISCVFRETYNYCTLLIASLVKTRALPLKNCKEIKSYHRLFFNAILGHYFNGSKKIYMIQNPARSRQYGVRCILNKS